MSAAACEDPPAPPRPDADAGAMDGGQPPKDGGLSSVTVLQSGQLHPAAEQASASGYELRGRLGAHSVVTATAGPYRLRGGLRPLTR